MTWMLRTYDVQTGELEMEREVSKSEVRRWAKGNAESGWGQRLADDEPIVVRDGCAVRKVAEWVSD